MKKRKNLTSDIASDTITVHTDETKYDVHLYAPEGLEDADQKLAYQEFINVLTAILVKYAAEIDLND